MEKQQMEKPRLLVGLTGELRTFRMAFSSFLGLLTTLMEHFQVVLVLMVKQSTTVISWKQGKERTFLESMYQHEQVRIDDALWNDMVEQMRRQVTHLLILDVHDFVSPLLPSSHHVQALSRQQLLKATMASFSFSFDACLLTRPDIVYVEPSVSMIVDHIHQVIGTRDYRHVWDMIHIFGQPLIQPMLEQHIDTVQSYVALSDHYWLTVVPTDLPLTTNAKDNQNRREVASHLFSMYLSGGKRIPVQIHGTICTCRQSPLIEAIFHDYLTSGSFHSFDHYSKL